MRQQRLQFYYVMVMFTVMIWGTAYPAVRYLVVSGVDPYLVACGRVVASFIFACILLLLSREKPRIPAIRKNFLPFMAMAFFGSAGFFLLMSLGMVYTDAGKSSLLVGCNPIYIVILSALFLKEPISRRMLFGVIIAVAGVALTVAGADIMAGNRIVFRPADIVLLAAGMFWAVYSLLNRHYGHNLNYKQGFFWIFAISMLMMLPILLPRLPLVLELNAKQVFWIFYCGFVPGGLGYYLWNKGLNVLGASICGMFNSFLPVWSILFAVIFLHESMTWLQLLGGAVVVLGVLLGAGHASLPVNYETGRSLTEKEEESGLSNEG